MSDLLLTTRYRVAQHWRYVNDTPEARDTFGILSVENHPRLGIIISVWVEYKQPFQVGPNSYMKLPWFWLTQDAVDRSVIELVEEHGPLDRHFAGSPGEFTGWWDSMSEAEDWRIESATVGELVKRVTEKYKHDRDNWKPPVPDERPPESLGLWTLIEREEVGRLRELFEQHPTLVNDPLPLDEDDDYCYANGDPEFEDCSPLALAAYWGQIHVARLMLDMGADPRRANRGGWTPLHYSGRSHSRSDNPSVVARLLCERGADPRAHDKDGKTPMTCGYCLDTVAAVLFEFGAELTLNHAIRLRNLDEARRILGISSTAVRDTAFPREVVDDLVTYVHTEAESRHSLEVGEGGSYFSITGIRFDRNDRIIDDSGATLAKWHRRAEIQQEVFEECRDLFDAALAQGADPNGTSALWYATQGAFDTSVVELLLSRGADPNRYVSKGTYLTDLSFAGTRRMVDLLRRYGAKDNPYTREKDRWEAERDEYLMSLRDRFV
jgi:hypothetical protein